MDGVDLCSLLQSQKKKAAIARGLCRSVNGKLFYQRFAETFDCAKHNAQGKGEQRAGRPQPRGQHRHQLGVTKANALAPADEPVDPADEENEAGGGEDSEQSLPEDVPHEAAPQAKRSIECEYAFGVNCRIEESGGVAEQDTWDREFVWEPKMLEIQN